MSAYPQVLLKNLTPGETIFIDGYRKGGGYEGLKKAFKEMSPPDVVDAVKKSNLRGRGGAGFFTGLKWGFFPSDKAGPKFLVCNGDEMEPGTYKDGVLLRTDPHQLIEGMIISAYALQTPVAYIFIRYAYEDCAQNLERAVAEAEAAGFLGKDILGSGFDCEIHVHRSAGRYICGEETALLSGLEGRRPNPRLKPPFPAVRGLFDQPTTVNNVETLANVQHIITGGHEWFKDLALTDEGAGTKLFGLSGHLEKTECFELPLGITLGEVVNDVGGGVRGGKKFKACLPGGASTPYLTAGHFDVQLDFETITKAGSRLGTAGITVFDEETCMVAVTLNLIRFFARESCGWCTPCRDGLPYVAWLLEQFEVGKATDEHVDLLRKQFRNISGRSFCALAEGAMGPVEGLFNCFEDELMDHVKKGGCPFKT